MIVAAYAIQADIAYIFLRAEYKLAAERLSRALAEAYESHYLGKNILGSGYSLEMYLHVSAGRYMCGEETGLLNALEGKRANPRSKPPFPPSLRTVGKTYDRAERRNAVQRASHRQQRSGVVHRASATLPMGEPSSMVQVARSNARACGSCPWARPSAKFWKNMREGCAMV